MTKKQAEMSMSLFDYAEEEKVDIEKRLEVVKLDFIGSELFTWKELFSGFDEIRAVTFSSGISFVSSLLDLFDYAEIIFGCEDVISTGLKEIMAYQDTLLDLVRKDSCIKDKLIERIKNNTAHFYCTEGVMSHEKIYLLSSNDGRRRVIMGSANMSFNAFGGRQRENITYVDSDLAYEYYVALFENLKENSSDEITKKAIEVANLDEHLDALPISEKIEKCKVISIETEQSPSTQFILDVNRRAKSIAPSIPQMDKCHGGVLIDADIVKKIKKQRVVEKKMDEEQKHDYPKLVVDVNCAQVMLNDQVLNLKPSFAEVQMDVDLFLKYMNGYERFHGDVAGVQYRYFEFANWFFCSPFMGIMRDTATRYNLNKLPYPVFGLLYGQSKAGKTSFLKTLLRMMIGQEFYMEAGKFTRSSIEETKRTVKGAPIIVDDLTNLRFNQHAIETIKSDDFGVASHMVHYPAVVISANEDVKVVAPEIVRRTVICRADVGLTNTEVMKDSTVKSVQQKIGTAFYREYLQRMLVIVEELIEQMKMEETESAPDILKYSSEVLIDIIREHVSTIPQYVHPLSLENYFSEKITGRNAIRTIQNAWKTSSKSFKVNKKNNELRYNAGVIFEADRIIKELPENLEAHKSREWIIMNLDAAQEFFGLRFRKFL